MCNVARAPSRAESRTVRRNWPPLISATELYPARKRVQKNLRTWGSFSIYVSTARDARSTWWNCSVPISRRLRPGKLAKNVSFRGFESTLALSLIASAFFFLEQYFRTWCISKLLYMKLTRKSVVLIVSTKWTGNAWLTLHMIFGVGSPVETGFMIDGYG